MNLKKIVAKFVFTVSACATISVAMANTVEFNVTASTVVTGIPASFDVVKMSLLQPWYFGVNPSFSISSVPSHRTMLVDSAFNIPALQLTDNVPTSKNHGLTWYFTCNGLTLNYGDRNNTATIRFSGQLASNPADGVTCTCSGNACSTTQPVQAKLIA